MHTDGETKACATHLTPTDDITNSLMNEDAHHIVSLRTAAYRLLLCGSYGNCVAQKFSVILTILPTLYLVSTLMDKLLVFHIMLIKEIIRQVYLYF